MNEEELQRIEKGFARATPLSIYNPHGDRALADIMVDLESRTIVPALIAEVRRLQSQQAVAMQLLDYCLEFFDNMPFDDYPPALDAKIREFIRLARPQQVPA